MTRVRILIAAAVAVAFLALLAPGEVAAQCAMCRTALDSPEGRQLAAGLRWGILLLLAAPFTAFGTVAYFAVRSQRRREELRTAPEPNCPVD